MTATGKKAFPLCCFGAPSNVQCLLPNFNNARHSRIDMSMAYLVLDALFNRFSEKFMFTREFGLKPSSEATKKYVAVRSTEGCYKVLCQLW